MTKSICEKANVLVIIIIENQADPAEIIVDEARGRDQEIVTIITEIEGLDREVDRARGIEIGIGEAGDLIGLQEDLIGVSVAIGIAIVIEIGENGLQKGTTKMENEILICNF